MGVQSGGLDINETVGNAISKEMNDMAGAIDRLTSAVQNAKSSTKSPIEIGVKLKTAVNMDLNSGATLKKTLDQVEKQVDKIFKKRAIQATLQIAEPGKYGSTARSKKYDSLVSNAKAQGYTGNDFKKIESTYDTILRTMSAISSAQTEIDNFNFKNYHDLENYVNLLTQLYNSRKQLGELNKSLPQDLQLPDTYKSFKEMSHIPKFDQFLTRYKESAIDAIYTNTQLISSINEIIATGKELNHVDLSHILGEFAKTDELVAAEKRTKRATRNMTKYIVDMETALEKIIFQAKKKNKGTIAASGITDLVGYFTSYIAQGGKRQIDYQDTHGLNQTIKYSDLDQYITAQAGGIPIEQRKLLTQQIKDWQQSTKYRKRQIDLKALELFHNNTFGTFTPYIKDHLTDYDQIVEQYAQNAITEQEALQQIEDTWKNAIALRNNIIDKYSAQTGISTKSNDRRRVVGDFALQGLNLLDLEDQLKEGRISFAIFEEIIADFANNIKPVSHASSQENALANSINKQEQLTGAIQNTIEARKQEAHVIAEATEKATATIERQQKIAANAPIASVKSDNATIYQNAWKDVISNQAKNLAVSDKTLIDANALLQSAQSSLRNHVKIAKEAYKQVLKEQIRNTPKQKESTFKIPSSGYVVDQAGDVDQEESSWRYLLQLNNFQKQTIANVSDKDGNWQEVESKVFTNFKKLSADIIECDTAILKLNNDYNNLGKTKTGQHQNGQPLLDEIEAKIEERDRLVKMAKKVGSDPAYAADYWQFAKDRQDNIAQVKRDLAIANSKQDAKIALEAANTAKKIADDAVKKITTADAKLASMKQTIKTIQAGYTSGKSLIPDEEVRNLLDIEATDIKSYIDSFIGKGLKQNDIFAIEDKINSLKQSVESFRLDPKLASDKLKLTSEIDGLLEKLKASKEPTGQFQLALEKIRKALNTPLEKSQFNSLKNTFNDLKTSIKNAEIFVKKTKETTKAINDYRDGLIKSGELTKAIDDEINKLQNQLGNIKTITGIEAVNNGLKELKANASTLPKTVAESFNVALHKMYELTDALNKIKELQALQATDPTISYKSQITGAQKVARQLQDELSVMKPESFMQKNIRQISQVQIDEYQQLKEEARQTAEAIGSIGSNIGGYSGGNNPPNKIEQLKKALKDLYNEQLNLTKLSNGRIINTEAISQSEDKINSLSSTVANLRKEVEQTYGVNVVDTVVKNINSEYSTKFTSAFGKTLQDYTNSIEKFKTQFTSDQYGDFGAMMAKNIQPQIEEIQTLAKEYQVLEDQIKTTSKVADLTAVNQQKQLLGEKISTKINTLENLSFSSLFAQLEKLGSFANTSGKIGAYSQKLGELHRELALLANEKLTGNLSENYTERFQRLLNDIAHFASTAESWNLEQKNGFLNLGATNITDLDDLSAAMSKYAKEQNLVIDNNKQINKDYEKQTVTQYYRNQNKELVKLTGTLKENMGYVKQVSLGHTGLMGDWGVAFGGFAKQLASYYTGYQAFTRIIGQAREGLNVLKQYDAALTDMSYSMDVTEKDLDRLGSSAVTMAKDLSTSLEDTLGIYQIYANMNTSIQEIEDTAKPTAILSNLGGIDALQASDQIQGVLQQFNMIEEGGANAAEASMHVVDVFDNIASNVSIDYVKGMQTISEAVTATGSVAYDAGMSFEQLAAVTAKVAERTREDGGTIGNAIKTIVTRISKVGKMPAYADEVSNEELSKASEALNEIGIAVYNADGSFRELDVILTELRDKWDGLTDAQQANLSFQIAATRQTSKFKNILESWTEAMSIADAASVTSGNAEANQEKYEESVNGKLQKISTQWDAFWLSVYDSKATDFVLDFFIKLTGGIDNLAQSLGGGLTAATLFFNLFAIKGKFLKKGALSQPKTRLQTYIIIIKWAYYHKEYYIMA